MPRAGGMKCTVCGFVSFVERTFERHCEEHVLREAAHDERIKVSYQGRIILKVNRILWDDESEDDAA